MDEQVKCPVKCSTESTHGLLYCSFMVIEIMVTKTIVSKFKRRKERTNFTDIFEDFF